MEISPGQAGISDLLFRFNPLGLRPTRPGPLPIDFRKQGKQNAEDTLHRIKAPISSNGLAKFLKKAFLESCLLHFGSIAITRPGILRPSKNLPIPPDNFIYRRLESS